MKKLAIICRVDNGGLGTLSKYFVKHLKPDKIMSVISGLKAFPDRFPSAMIVNNPPSDAECSEFLKDIDILLAWETPYNWNIFRMAKQKGIKTIMFIDYEWLAEPIPFMPDLLVNPSNWYMENLPSNSVHIPCPVDREVHPFKLREKALTFLHIVGHGGSHGRNGTAEFLQAIPLVKSSCKFIIHSQVKIDTINDSRIEWRIGNYMDESCMFQDADVLVYPRKFAGLSLPLNEAMSHGLAIIMSDMNPQNQFLPKDLLIPVSETATIKICREIELGSISPQAIADKIDMIAGKDITEYSKYSDKWAESISWKTLKPRISALFE
jgi:glycosyltransferase involved in cell wall biosynthesis